MGGMGEPPVPVDHDADGQRHERDPMQLYPLILPEEVTLSVFFFQAEDGIRDLYVTGVQTCALPILDAIVELVHAVEQPRVGQPEAVELRSDPLLAIRGAPGVLGHADRVGGVVRAVGADQHAAALGEPRDAEGAEERVQQARVVRVLDVLEVELPVVRQPLGEASEHLHRLAHHAAHAAEDLGAEVLLDRRRLGRQRREDEATERGRPQLARSVIGLAEVGGHPAAAVAALLERNADQVAAQVIAPRVVDALERVLHAARVVQRDQGAAVRAAVLERVDTAVLPAHHDHRHLADERRPEVAGLRDVGLQAHEAPGGAFEDAAQLGAVVRLVLVDPERHAGQRVGRPGAGGLAHGREYTPASHASGPAVDRSRGATSLAEYRGVPRLGRGAPSVWGVWGAISGPSMWSIPLPLVGDLLRVLGNGAGGDDGDDPAQLHDVADGGLEGGGDGVSVGAGAQLDPQREGVVVALAADDDLVPAHALDARDDLVGLAGMDEHAAHLGDLVGTAAPAQHACGAAAALARLVGDDRQIPGAEANHRVGAIVDRGHQLADLAVGQRLAGGGIAHLGDRLLDEVHAARLRALVGDDAEVGGAEALARHDAVRVRQLPAHRLGEGLGADLGDLDRQAAHAHLPGLGEDRHEE